MVTMAQVCGCIKRLHPDLKHRVKEDTLLKYQKSFEVFTEYLQKQYDLVLTTPEDLDLLLMEFRTEADLTKSQHMTLVAAAEFFLPHVKGKLNVCREALRGRMAAEEVKHTIPLTLECAYLFGAWHASQGRQRIGAAMLIQHSTGLRPSELLALQPAHVHLPLDRSQSLTVRLGATYSTKVKREQYILVDPSSQSLAFSLLARLCMITPAHERLFPFGYQVYNNAFKLAEAHYELNLGTTAHSGRSGFATHLVLLGHPRKEVQARGRWLSESSFNTYIDVAGASHIAAQVSGQRLERTAPWIQSHIWSYFGLQQAVNVSTQPDLISRTSDGSSRFQIKTGEGPDSRSPGSPFNSSTAGVASAEVGRVVRAAVQSTSGSSSSTSLITTQSKGKGRGFLRRRGDPKSSIFRQ